MWFTRKSIPAFLSATLAAALLVVPALAAGGSINTLDITDASQPDVTLTISSTGTAASKISNSNLYYTITSPGNAIVASHVTSLGSMSDGDTYTDSWTASNSGWPRGTYTLTLCWSTGGSHNCNIDSASSTFYSVPALGWELGLTGLALLLYFLWRRRKEFKPAAERIRG
jgi:hypothetical protein